MYVVRSNNPRLEAHSEAQEKLRNQVCVLLQELDATEDGESESTATGKLKDLARLKFKDYGVHLTGLWCEWSERKLSLQEMPQMSSSGCKLLLVDDSKLMLAVHKRFINQSLCGHELKCAESGENALDIVIHGFVPDIILMDLNMPGLHGDQTCKLLRLLGHAKPIIIGCSTDEAAAEKFQNAGANGILVKTNTGTPKGLLHKVLAFCIDRLGFLLSDSKNSHSDTEL